MNIIRNLLFAAMIVVGLSMDVSAQKGDDQKRPPKNPPTVDPKPKETPKETPKPKDEDKPKKPEMAFLKAGRDLDPA